MPIEIKEIIVRTAVTENSKPFSFDQFQLKKMKVEIISELKKEMSKTERRKKRR